MADRAHATGQPLLSDALRDLGHDVHLTRHLPGHHGPRGDIPEWLGECVVAYGGMPFLRQLLRHHAGNWQPGAFFRTDLLSYSSFGAHLGDLLLNDDFVILPFAELERRRLDAWGGQAFVRPDVVTKPFPGFVLKESEWNIEINSLRRLQHVQPTDLVVVASVRPILGEFRFVIADGRVVTGSAYGWNGILDIRSDVDERCLALALKVAQREWQADLVYTCDVALTSIDGIEQARLLELNAFSSSGLYACDTVAIAKAVSSAALKEFSDV